MKPVATLTVNPTIDVAYEVDHMVLTHKVRAFSENHDPGGGGINVARVLARLGTPVRCHYLSGGPTGQTLDGLLAQQGLDVAPVRIAGHTRICTNILEREGGNEYRIIAPGPDVAAAEWQASLDVLEAAECSWIVASGSLAPGMPDDFYARVAAIARRRGVPMALDTSGRGLPGGLSGAGLFLLKASEGELADLAGRDLPDHAALADAAMALIAAGKARLVAVTMGGEGALLAGPEGVSFLPAIAIPVKSAVGAGDSFLAGMVHALSHGEDAQSAFRLGLAAGAAALLTQGTGLALAEDIARLRAQIGG